MVSNVGKVVTCAGGYVDGWRIEDGVDGARRRRSWYIKSKRLLICWLVGDRRRGGWWDSELLGHGQEGAERRS